MKEVVNLQIGRCGNNIGTQFWELLCNEHGLNCSGNFRGTSEETQLSRVGSYFREVRGLRYVARSVVVDLDKETMDIVKSSPYSSLFKPENFLYLLNGTGNNWAQGHLTEGLKLRDAVLNTVRREAESTDCLHAFQISHSIGGGTGSGFGTLLMDSIKDEYPGRTVATFTVIPSTADPKSGVEIYNAVLSMSHLTVDSDETYFVDNLALHQICTDIPKLSNYNLSDLNHVISSAMSGITTSMRFCGQPNTDFRKIAVNFVPYPRIHFFVPSLAPLVPRAEIQYRSPTVTELFQGLFAPRKMFVHFDVKDGKFMTAAALVRGAICMKEVMLKLREMQDRNSAKFIEWIPDNAKTFVYELPASVVGVSATMISNTTGIQDVLKRLKTQFQTMFRRKAFLASYKAEGMDEMEFEEAAANLSDLIDEYRENNGPMESGSVRGSNEDHTAG